MLLRPITLRQVLRGHDRGIVGRLICVAAWCLLLPRENSVHLRTSAGPTRYLAEAYPGRPATEVGHRLLEADGTIPASFKAVRARHARKDTSQAADRILQNLCLQDKANSEQSFSSHRERASHDTSCKTFPNELLVHSHFLFCRSSWQPTITSPEAQRLYSCAEPSGPQHFPKG